LPGAPGKKGFTKMSTPQPTFLDTFNDFPQPDLRIPFKVLLSLNDILYATPMVVRGLTSTWVKNGRARAAEVLQAAEWPGRVVSIRKEGRKRTDGQPPKIRFDKYWRAERPFFIEPVCLIVRLWRPTASTYDIANMLIKPVVDGFRDTGVFTDDDVTCMPQVGFDFVGIDRNLAYSEAERAERKAIQDARKEKGKGPKPMPLRMRIWFDFFKRSRIRGCSIYQFSLLEEPND
jgi:hypothetical protein